MGTSTDPRRVQHVAAGLIDAFSTDAINGSQLYLVADKLKTEIDTKASPFTTYVNGTQVETIGKDDTTVHFANGLGTTARFIPATGTDKNAQITFDVNVDDETVKIVDGKLTAVAPNVVGTGLANVTSETKDGVTTYTVDVPKSEAPSVTGGKLNLTTGGDTMVLTANDTINAINNSGFTLTTSAAEGKKISGDDETINPGDTVDLVAGKNLTVKQEANGKVTFATGETVHFTTINVGETPVINIGVGGINMGGKPITNLPGNLTPTFNNDEYNPDGKTVTMGMNLPSNLNLTAAATVGDILNSGWNLQNNGNSVDFVKPYDTVNFVNGNVTTAVATPNGDGTSTDVAYNVNFDPNTLTTINMEIPVVDAEGNIVLDDQGNTVMQTVPSLTVNTGDINANPIGDVSGPVTQEMKDDLAAAEKALADLPDTATEEEKAAAQQAVEDAQNAINQAGNKVATAQNVADAINASGWNVTSGAVNGGAVSGTTNELVQPGETVTFQAGKHMTLEQAGQTFTYSVNAQSITEDAQLPVVYTDEEGNKVTIIDGNFYPEGSVKLDGNVYPEGTVLVDGKPVDKDGNPVDPIAEPIDKDTIIASMNNGNNETAPMQLTNVGSNLPNTYNIDLATPNGNPEDTENPVTKEQKLPVDKDGNFVLNVNNAATVGDILNSGWNLQNNGNSVDFVKPYDTVNFVDGNITTAVATASKDGTTSNVTYNVNFDPNTLTTINMEIPVVDAEGNIVLDDQGNTVMQTVPSLTVNTGDINANPIGDVSGPVTQEMKDDLAAAEKALADLPDTATEEEKAAAQQAVEDAQNAINQAGNKVATAQNVADAINASGWNVTSGAVNGGAVSGTTNELVQPGETVTFQAGKHMTLEQAGQTFTYSVNAQSITEDAQLPVVYTDEEGNKVTIIDGNFYPEGSVKLDGNVYPEGTVLVDGKPVDKDGNPVDPIAEPIDKDTIIASMNNGNNETAPMQLTNVGSNLPNTYNIDLATPNGNPEDTENPVTKEQKLPVDKDGNFVLNVNNAATVGDILNSGWNLQNNGNSVDFVKPYDTVNFVNGKGTTAVAKPNDDGTVSNVQYDINVDNSTIVFNEKPMLDANGDIVLDAEGNTVTFTELTVNTGDINANPIGDVKGPVTAAEEALKAAEEALNNLPDTATEEERTAAEEAVEAAKNKLNNAGNKVATAQNVADAINASGWNLTTSASKGQVSGETVELISPSDFVTIDAGKNIAITQDGSTITIATGDTVEFTTVNFNGGPRLEGDGKGNLVLVNLSEDPNKLPAITGISSGLDTTPVVINPNGTPDVDMLVNLDTPDVSDDTALTVGDARNMGWVVAAEGNDYQDTVKNANKVNFVGEGMATVTGETKDGVRTITVNVDAQNLVENAQLPVVYTDEEGNKVTIIDGNFYPEGSVKLDGNVYPEGTVLVDGKPVDKDGNPVDPIAEPIDKDTIIASMNNGNNETAPMQLTNVGSNLPNTYNIDLATPNGNPEDTENPVTKEQKLPVDKDGNFVLNVNNAATVGDILNSGWNLQNNGNSVDFVKPYDTVNFVNGKGTTAVAKPNDDGTVSNVQYDINVDNSTIVFNEKPMLDANGDIVLDAEGNTVTFTELTVNTGDINANPIGDVKGPVTAAEEALKAAEEALNNLPDTATEEERTAAEEAVEAAKNKLNNAGNKVATAQNVADAINASGWNLTTSASKGQVSGETVELISPSDFVTIDAGKNIAITQDGSTITIATGDTVEFTTVNFNGGPRLEGDGKGNLVLVNLSEDPNKLPAITGISSGLDTTPVVINPNGTPDVDMLVNLDTPDVSDDTALTVGDARNMGWVVAAEGNDYQDTVKNANKVNFVGEGMATVTGETKDGVRTITVNVDAQNLVENAQLPVVYTDEEGNKVTIIDGNFYPEGSVKLDGNVYPEGTVLVDGKPVDKDGNPVDPIAEPIDKDTIIASMNNGNNETAPMQLTNVGSNLPNTYNIDLATPNGNPEDTENPVTKEQKLPVDKDGNFVLNVNNAATVGDILNSGWNLQNNGNSVDFVKPYDTVNFVDGNITTAVATASKDGTTSNVTYNVNFDPNTLTTINMEIPVVDAEGNIVLDDQGNTVMQTVPSLTVNTGDINANPIGDVSGPVTQEMKDDLAAAEKALADLPDTATEEEKAAAQQAVEDAQNAINQAGNKVATAQNVADAINASGWNVTSGAVNGGAVSGTTNELVQPGETVTFQAGKHMTLEQAGQTFTYSVNAQSITEDAQLPVVYTDEEGNKVTIIDGNFYPEGSVKLDGNVYPEGTVLVDGKPVDKDGNPVDPIAEPIDKDTIIASMNNGNNETAPMQLTNVGSNLPNTYNIDLATPNGNPEDTENPVTKEQKLPVDKDGNFVLNVNNAATVGDILNSGWNLQNNGNSVDFVKPYDTVNFVNGKGTTAVAKPNDDGTVSNVQYDINVDNSTIVFNEKPMLDANGDIVLDAEGNTVTFTELTVNTGDINANPIGDVKGPVTAAEEALKAAEEALNNLPDTATEEERTAAEEAVEAAKNKLNNAGNKVATAQNVADAINASGWNLTTSASKGQVSGETVELISPSDFVTIDAGKNIAITQDGSTITIATGDTVEFTTVNFNGGPRLEGDGKGNLVLVNLSEDPNKLPAITGISSGLDTTPVVINPNGTPDVDMLVNLDTPDVSDDTALTVGDARNMGWVVAAEGNDYQDTVKNANKVNFVGEGMATVTGETKDGVRTITVNVDAQNLVENAQLPVVYTDEEGNKVTIIDGNFYPEGSVKLDGNVYPEGTVLVDGKPVDKDGNPVDPIAEPIDKDTIIASMNNGNNETAPMQLTNVGSNLPNTYNIDLATPNGNPEDTENPVTKEQKLPVDKDGNFVLNVNNAATVGDILNSGWNLQNNGNSVDFVKPYDTVNFVDGNITTAVATASKDGTTSNVTYNVNFDPNTLTTINMEIPVVDAEGNIVLDDQGNTVMQTVPSLTVNTGDINANPIGDVSGPVTQEMKDDLAAAEKALADLPDTATEEEKAAAQQAVEDAQNAINQAGNKVATAQNVADAINASGWNVTSGAVNGGAVSGTTNELVQPGKTVTFQAGKNMKLVQNGQTFTYETQDEVEFTSVQFGVDGPKITNVGGNINVGDVNGAPVKITGVADGDIGPDSNDAINGSQLYWATAASKTEVRAGTNVANVTQTVGENGQSIYTVNAEGTNVKAGSDNVTVTHGQRDGDNDVTYTVDIAKDLVLDSVTTGDATLDGKGLSIVGGPSITVDGIDAGGKTISGVKAGVNPDDAVNVSQLTQAVNGAKSTVSSADDSVTVRESVHPATGATNYDLSVKTDGTTITSVPGAGLTVNTTPLVVGEDGKVIVPTDENAGKLPTAGDVANAINSSSFTLTAQGENGSKVQPGSTVDMNNTDGNIVISKTPDSNNVTYNLANDLKVNTVKVGGENGPTIGADEEGNVRIGDNNGEPVRITNVAPGVDGTDAVNVNQLKDFAGNINNRISGVADDANAGVSSAMAMAALPQAYIPGKSMLTGGMATYNGESAVAVGFSKLSDNGRWVLKMSGSADSQGNAGAAIGAGFHF
ncbi:YadA-like C-terminal region [Moraxella caviae]|nr:YadA-like C-terminal region [Moraxella caviae]